MRLTHLGILAFVVAVIAGPLYTVSGYSPVRNLISELSAQSTQGNWLMSAGFVALGLCLAYDGVRAFSVHQLPFIAFGILMLLAGLFSHNPIAPEVPFVQWAHTAHSALATAAGISITIGLAWQAGTQQSVISRVVAGTLALVCLAFPLAMFRFPGVQGLVQRAMYVLVFAWLFHSYPLRTHA
jgi:hypothetical membrane protein